MVSLLEKYGLFDTLFIHALVAGGMSINDDIIVDRDNRELAWDDMEYINLNTNIIYEDYNIDGVLVFGDGTIEFHDANSEEAFNWVEFPKEIIEKISELLKISSL